MGRPSLGPRAEIKVRLPYEVREALRHCAAQIGVSENEIMSTLIASYTGLGHLTPRIPNQLELPLPKSA